MRVQASNVLAEAQTSKPPACSAQGRQGLRRKAASSLLDQGPMIVLMRRRRHLRGPLVAPPVEAYTASCLRATLPLIGTGRACHSAIAII